MIIVDRRLYSREKSKVNLQRFLDRHDSAIKDAIDKMMDRIKIGDVGKDTDREVVFNTIKEPALILKKTEDTTRKEIWVNNRRFYRDDIFWMKKSSESGDDGDEAGRGDEQGSGGNSEDLFQYTMTRDEFLDLYFKDLELPNYIKEGIKKDNNKKLVRCGYSKDGIPARLNLRKTFENAIARKVSAKRDPNKKPRWLDDEDLRYNYYDLREFPIKHAVIFLVMDVSGSMDEQRKRLAKKFYTLLYTFLMREYDNVELVFIRHTDDAKECGEREFFFGVESGATVILPALELVNSIIDERYNINNTNIYVAQTSDGDTFGTDAQRSTAFIKNTLLNKLQYFAYIQTNNRKPTPLTSYYGKLAAEEEKFNLAWVDHTNELFQVFSKLFEKR